MRKFREERRSAIREEWRALSVFLAFTVAAAVLVVTEDGWTRVLAAFALGCGLTAFAFGWMLGFDATSLRWAWGAWGEQWTAEELAKLPADWRVYHDIADGRGNWDHVVVGAPGVFVVDSKRLSEPAVVDDNGLRAGRLRVGGSASRGSAVRMKEIIQRETGLAVWVQGVVAVWGELSAGMVERDKVIYVPARQLVDTLESRPKRLTPDQCSRVSARLAR
jgi:Nuclease-related domain